MDDNVGSMGTSSAPEVMSGTMLSDRDGLLPGFYCGLSEDGGFFREIHNL